MKTLINSIITATLVTVLSVSATFAQGQSKIVHGEHVKFNNINVSGNVEVTIKNAGRSKIVYSEGNTGSVKVSEQGGKLTILSKGNEIAKVTVYVNELYRIQGSEHAVIKTEDKLNVKYLQLFLSGDAIAEIDSKTEGLYTVLRDNANLSLSGATTDHALVMGHTQKLSMNQFAALNTETRSLAQHQEIFALSK